MLLSYHLLDDFVNLLLKNNFTNSNSNSNFNSNTNKIIVRLFTEIDKSINIVNNSFNVGDINFRESNEKDTYMIKSFLLENPYLNTVMRNFIRHQKYQIVEYNYLDKHFTFIDYTDTGHTDTCHTDTDIDIYTKRFKQLMVITMFLEKYQNPNCHIKQLSTRIFLTPFNKLLPAKTSDDIISGENINSGYTIPCLRNSQIFIWREEEYFKVYIHELMHAMGIDFATMNTDKLKHGMVELFPMINGDFNMAESYADIWALLLNNLFFTATTYNSSNYHKKRIKLFLNLFQIDKLWTIYQSTKILKNYKINSYEDLIHNVNMPRNIPREKTNAFTYFIGKAILMISLDDFINYCYKSNSRLITFSQSNINNNTFLYFIKSHIDNIELLRLFELFESNMNDDKLHNCMRWSGLEWI